MKKQIVFWVLITILASCTSKRRAVLQNPKADQPAATYPSSNVPLKSNEYISRYKDIAIREMEMYGIPASIKLAQALLESGNGTSYLAQRGNNHFGIKCGGDWKGRTVSRNDDRPNECFRAYDNPEQSFRDHSNFLLRKRYEKLFNLDKNDYRSWAYGLKSAGYATNPRYPELLISMIERYELYKYDYPEVSPAKKEHREEKVEEIIEEKKEPPKEEDIKNPIAMQIYEVKAGDTLRSISKNYQVSVESIIENNGLEDSHVNVGQLLVISQ
ncbi:MAG TPA: glucosaminidase domain-containing protein [Sphingobacterium sp.]|nr:glucosaminidase domain-containing protein [Sphingobacterium sp.]